MACPPPLELVERPTPPTPFEILGVTPTDGAQEAARIEPLTAYFSRDVGSVRFTVWRAAGPVTGQALVSADRRSATFRPTGKLWRGGATYQALIEATSDDERAQLNTRFTVQLDAHPPASLQSNTWDLVPSPDPRFPTLADAMDAGPRQLITLLDFDGQSNSAGLVLRFGPMGAAHAGTVPLDLGNPRSWHLQGSFEGDRITLDDPGVFAETRPGATLTLLFDESENRIDEWRFEGGIRIEELIPEACKDLDCDEDGFTEFGFGGIGLSNPIGVVPFVLNPTHDSMAPAATDVIARWTAPLDLAELSVRFEELDDLGNPLGPAVELGFVPFGGAHREIRVVGSHNFPAAADLRLWLEHPDFNQVRHWLEFSTIP
jgi:hypothetical protein